MLSSSSFGFYRSATSIVLLLCFARNGSPTASRQRIHFFVNTSALIDRYPNARLAVQKYVVLDAIVQDWVPFVRNPGQQLYVVDR
jgi:hypothetical protein